MESFSAAVGGTVGPVGRVGTVGPGTLGPVGVVGPGFGGVGGGCGIGFGLGVGGSGVASCFLVTNMLASARLPAVSVALKRIPFTPTDSGMPLAVHRAVLPLVCTVIFPVLPPASQERIQGLVPPANDPLNEIVLCNVSSGGVSTLIPSGVTGGFGVGFGVGFGFGFGVGAGVTAVGSA